MTNESAFFVKPDGTSVMIHGGPEASLSALVGKVGLDGLPYTNVVEKSPGIDGGILQSTLINPRIFQIPLLVRASSVGNLEAELYALHQLFRASNGVGKLQWYTANNEGREINCIYQGGLEGNDGLAFMQDQWAKRTIRFIAVDPFWYDLAETDLTYELDDEAATSFLGDPFLPLNITPSTVFNSPAVSSIGDEKAWPTFQISGPGDTIYITNNTSGKTLNFSGNGGLVLATGEVITINTKEATIVDAVTSENLFSYLSKDSEFWALEPGTNSLDLLINNADTNTEIQLSYRGTYSGRYGGV